MFVCCECCVLSGRGLCDGFITRPEESYRLWRVVLCDQETSNLRRLKTAKQTVKNTNTMGCDARQTNKQTNNFIRLKLNSKFCSYMYDLNFLMKMGSQKAQMAFQSCSLSFLNDIQSVIFRFVPNFLSLSPLQLAVYKRKERKHCHCLCSVPTANAQLLSSSQHSGKRVQQHYDWKLTYITEHCTNLTLNDSDYGTGMSDILVVANCIRTKGQNVSKN